MSKLNQYIPFVVENNEWMKMQDGEINQVQNAPTHDEELILGNKVINVPKGRGGIDIQGVEKVLSATHENRNSKDSTYTYKDEEIKILPKEVADISQSLNLKTSKQNKGISPSKLFTLLLEAKNKQLAKYENIKYGDTHQAKNSSLANEAVINTIPLDEDLFEAIFNIQESKKSYDEESYQHGGDYWKRFNWTIPEEEIPFSLMVNPNIVKAPLAKENLGFFISTRQEKDNLYVNPLYNVDRILEHENIHRNQYFRGDRVGAMNENIFDELSNTPPYNKDVYDRFGNAAEAEAYLETEDNREEINNFLSKKNQQKFLDSIIRQQGGDKILYVDSKENPRYKSYKDSLDLYNSNKLSRKLNSKFNFIKEGKFIPYNNLKNELIKHYGKTDSNLYEQPNGTIQYGKFNYFKNKDFESGYWENADNYSKFMKKKHKNLPIGFIEELNIDSYPNQPDYNAIYKKPTQQVKVLNRTNFGNINELDNIDYKFNDFNQELPNIEYHPTFKDDYFRSPVRVIGSEYIRNPDFSYGRYEPSTRGFQVGGRLQVFPTMYGTKPAALVNTPQGVKTVTTINNRTVSMDDLFINRDSVVVNDKSATIIPKKPKLIKKK